MTCIPCIDFRDLDAGFRVIVTLLLHEQKCSEARTSIEERLIQCWICLYDLWSASWLINKVTQLRLACYFHPSSVGGQLTAGESISSNQIQETRWSTLQPHTFQDQSRYPKSRKVVCGSLQCSCNVNPCSICTSHSWLSVWANFVFWSNQLW